MHAPYRAKDIEDLYIKVKLKFRGEKLGELLLKQILWFAFKNSYDLVYLTTFPGSDFPDSSS